MKILVISDSHGNVANLKHVLGFAAKIGAGAIIHCGDWDNVGVVDTVLNSELDVYSVLGNADIDEGIGKRLKVKGKRYNEKFLEIEIDGRKIGVVHDARQLGSLTAGQLDILFAGHKHKQEETIINGVKVINPGALEHDISFAVYDTKTDKVELIAMKHSNDSNR